jgi:hypothetical protein
MQQSGLNFKSEEKHSGPELMIHERMKIAFMKNPNYLKIRFCMELILQQKQIIYIGLEEYNPDLGGLVIEWTPEDVYQFFLSAMEESLEIIKELVLRRKLFFKDDNGNITVNPL